MQQPPTLCASELINPAEADITRTFGNTWRDRVGVVRGFRIQTGAGSGGNAIVYDLENLGALAVDNSHCLFADKQTHYFLLLPNEYVVQVDVYSTKSWSTTQGQYTTTTPGQIKAHRFRTNERVSEWFGNCAGTATHLEAPDGYFAQALYGAITRPFCGQIGVCYTPLTALDDLATGAEADAYALTEIVRGRETDELCFRVQHDQARAFVVRVDGLICDIAVVSEAQYKAFAELDPPHDHSSDNWFVLGKNERINVVGFVFQNGQLAAMRFRTNYRTSVWFGSQISSEATWLDCGDSPGAFICGFQLEGLGTTTCTRVTGIAAIYKIEGRKAREKRWRPISSPRLRR